MKILVNETTLDGDSQGEVMDTNKLDKTIPGYAWLKSLEKEKPNAEIDEPCNCFNFAINLQPDEARPDFPTQVDKEISLFGG